jgi:hypothetical protein
MFSTLDDVAAILASRPIDEDTIPLPVPPAGVRIVPARDVTEGDLIVAAVDRRAAGYTVDWFCEAYEAHPRAFDPTCMCGVCGLDDPSEGPYVVLTDGAPSGPWETCDPWPAARLVLIIPA